MKRFSFLLLVSLVSIFHASAQTHFITAGQTQGMIFTDYVPDYSITQCAQGTFGPYCTTNYYLDINKDGTDDFNLTVDIGSTSSHSSFAYRDITPLNQNSIFTKYSVPHCSPMPCSVPKFVSNVYMLNDTMVNSIDTFWRNSETIIANSNSSGPSGYSVYDDSLPFNSPFYFLLRIVESGYTFLGYLHMNIHPPYEEFILDYACEGPTSSYIINSTNDLFIEKSISTYPNPFTNQININYAKPFDYQITDYIGRVVLEGKAERTINTEQLPAGNYLLLIKNEETYSVKKIVKKP